MTEYIRGQRVRITRAELDEDAKYIGDEGTIRGVREGKLDGTSYRVRLDRTNESVDFYPEEFEPIGAVLNAPEEGDTVTVHGVRYPLITSSNNVAHIRVSPDRIVEWDALAALGFELDR